MNNQEYAEQVVCDFEQEFEALMDKYNTISSARMEKPGGTEMFDYIWTAILDLVHEKAEGG